MNTFTKEIMSVGEMACGTKLTVPVFSFKAEENSSEDNLSAVNTAEQSIAPNVYIQANMHGAEVQGNAVIFQLLELLQHSELKANITLVPYANPIGNSHKSGEYTLGRFDPITGENWNRMYHFDQSIIKPFAEQHLTSSEEEIKARFEQLVAEQIDAKLAPSVWGLSTGQRIAYQLQRLAHKADIVLDLHTGPISSKHLYCAEYSKASAKYFNIEHTLLIPNGFDGAMDEANFCPWWYLQEAFVDLGRDFTMGQGIFDKEAYTVELGSQEQIDLDVAKEDARDLLTYLQYKGAIGGSEYQPKEMTRYACHLKDYKTYYAPMGGMVDYLAGFGKPLAAGEPLARILRMDVYGDSSINKENESKALHYVSLDQTVLPILHFASANVTQGSELYKVFTNYFEF
ncbi:succinylglutamate desuccinylase/aspartoacylase family protein [Colwellia echini]|uniref:Succinylglutamate desuccinylase/aspartoacylase family protein n=1 Tax=Colwellia echini TaxID=1982103 RepID=A0ABY3MW06_9GAMM|nr:succinylglutamate desuccinylase/aspartoacylase family protein [Colwellia echini]TYK65369.1 succinylglutamate desuccinylase/aspartoacylase family protein [Colwellia echini]